MTETKLVTPCAAAITSDGRPCASGSVRKFKDLLHELYLAAGRPSLTAVAEDARSAAGRGPARTTVGAMLRVDSGLPSEEHAVVVGAALARIAGRNPGAVGEQLRAAWRAAHVASRTLRGRRPGVPVSAADPFALGVHQAGGTARLPKYLRRPHDDRAAGIVQQARSGSSRIMALVGPAGSGRARTAWEAVRTLPDVWRIWRTDGDPAEELLAAEPYTVVWLTDATALLQPDVGPMLVDAVRARVDDPGRGPVLVVLLIWPEDWFQLTAWLLPGEPDPHAAARSLLRGNDVVVPDAFTASQVAEARTGRDAVLREAAGADQGQVAQALAGVLDLLRRYRHAPPDVRDVLDTAIDARRFGCPPRIPAALLRQVVDDRDTARDAIAYAVSAGLLIATDAPTGAAERTYRLAGALYHAAAAERAAVFPPARFWNALAAAVTDPVLLRAAAGHAERRGRHARAAQMYRRAIDHGDATAIMPLSMLRERAGDHRGADELAVRAVELGDRRPLERFALRADDRGDTGRADALAHAAADAGDANVLCLLARRHPGTDRAETLYRAAAERGSVPASAAFAVIAFGRGDAADVERFARQAAAGGDTSALRRIADLHRHSGAYRQAERFAIAAAVYGHAFEHRVLREEQRWLGKPGAVAAALRRIAGDVDTAAVRRLQACQAISVTRALTMALRLACHRHTGPLRALATDRQRHGDQAGALRLAVIADRCADPSALTELALLADASADHAAAVQLAERAASHGDSTALRRLARAHRRTGDIDDAVQLLERATAGGDPDALFDLARTRHHAGDADTAEPLYRDAARGGSGDAANALAHLLQDTDPPAAARYAERAVQLGHPTAVRDLGRARYRVGDLRAAAALYRQAADGGDDTAARLLAQLWDRHHHDEAAELAIEAAEHGSPVVLRHLAGLREGAGRFDEAAALYWSAYVSGDQQALMQLPHMRAEDDGDQARADRLTLQTTPAQRQRAVADLGAVRALTGDLAAAERLYRRAAAAGVAVDLRPVIRARLATDAPLRESVATLYEPIAGPRSRSSTRADGRQRRKCASNPPPLACDRPSAADDPGLCQRTALVNIVILQCRNDSENHFRRTCSVQTPVLLSFW